MRITGGQARGTLLASFKGLSIRPTADQVREAIFNILGHELHGKRVLDLFAGTGAFGLEALSRGAAAATFVDSSAKAVRLIRKNIEKCKFSSRAVVLRRDLRKGLPGLRIMGGIPFDLVFIDPPYGKGLVPIVLSDLSNKSILMTEAVLVVETQRKENLSRKVAGFKLVDTRTYGDTKIHFLLWGDGND